MDQEMSGVRLDHATINTVDLAASLQFYERFLGFKPGWRPELGIGGAWLYAQGGDYPILHLIERPADPQGGMFDHIAFRARGLEAYLTKVKSSGCYYTAMAVPETTLVQIQHRDPNGVLIEIAFEGEPLDASEVRR